MGEPLSPNYDQYRGRINTPKPEGLLRPRTVRSYPSCILYFRGGCIRITRTKNDFRFDGNDKCNITKSDKSKQLTAQSSGHFVCFVKVSCGR